MASSSDSPSNALAEHLSDVARRELSALQTALDLRLSRLDAVLADPDRVESLEGLVIDLARVATQEAHTAATVACFDARRDADAKVAQFRASTQDGIERDQATIAELRQAVEQTQQRIALLEQEKQDERLSLQEQFDHALGRERASAAETERALDDAHQKVQRASSAELRRSAERVSELMATLEQEQTDAQEVQGRLSAELAGVREESAERERLQVETSSQLDAELAANATLNGRSRNRQRRSWPGSWRARGTRSIRAHTRSATRNQSSTPIAQAPRPCRIS